MSTDYDLYCKQCKTRRHLGQRSAGGFSFGWSRDDAEGQDEAGDFIMDHLGHGLRIIQSEHDPESGIE